MLRDQRQSRRYKLLFWIYCLSSALDFKGQGGGAFQVLLFSASSISFACFLIGPSEKTPQSRPTLRNVSSLWWLYLLISFVVAVSWNYSITNYGRALLPTLLMGESLYIGQRLLRRDPANVQLLIRGIYFASIVSSIVYIVNGFVFVGLTIETARYYIASPLLVPLFGLSLWPLVIGGFRSNNIRAITLLYALLVMFLSVTRTYLVAMGCVILCFAPMLVLSPAWFTRRVRSGAGRSVGILGISLVVFATSTLVLFPSVGDSWRLRTSVIGSGDATGLARIAQASGEISQMRSSIARTIFGSGIGSNYRMDENYLKGIPAFEGANLTEEDFEPAHIIWVYQLYATGLLMGWVLPFIFLIVLWTGLRKRSSYPVFMATSIIAGLIAVSTFGNVLGDRSGGAVLGLLIVIALGDVRVQTNDK
jgi:hypothetical protein